GQAGISCGGSADAGPSRATTRSARRAAWPPQVLRGLEHAHGLGFVHRDIKPENILIGRGKAGLVAKISDFGLAKSYLGAGLSGRSADARRTSPLRWLETLRAPEHEDE